MLDTPMRFCNGIGTTSTAWFRRSAERRRSVRRRSRFTKNFLRQFRVVDRASQNEGAGDARKYMNRIATRMPFPCLRIRLDEACEHTLPIQRPGAEARDAHVPQAAPPRVLKSLDIRSI